MEHATQIAKWGNSLAVRLPAAVVKVLGLKEGDEIEIDVAGARVLEVKKKPKALELSCAVEEIPRPSPSRFQI